jgi:hypothetical protein
VTDPCDSVERFLVEDVILTLGNLRGALRWLGEAGTGERPDGLRNGLSLIDRQLDALTERAVRVCARLGPPPSGQDTAVAAGPDALPLAIVLADALPDGPGQPQFRSRRRPVPRRTPAFFPLAGWCKVD